MAVVAVLGPYLVIWLMRGFEDGEPYKTDSESFLYQPGSSVAVWLLNGQIYSLLILLPDLNTNPRPAFQIFRVLLFMFGAIYGVGWAIFIVQIIIANMGCEDICFQA